MKGSEVNPKFLEVNLTLFECFSRGLTTVVCFDLLYCREEWLLASDLSALDSNHRWSLMAFVWCILKWDEKRNAIVFDLRREIMTAPLILFILYKQIGNVLRRSHTSCPYVKSVLIFKRVNWSVEWHLGTVGRFFV